MIIYNLEYGDNGLSKLTVRDDRAAKRVQEFTPTTVLEAQNRLHRSQRQIYRYMKNGTLRVIGNVLGMCLLDAKEVTRIEKMYGAIKKAGPLPKSAKPLFPEYSLKSLDPIRHGTLILGRILDRGIFMDVRWVLAVYGAERIKEFLASQGTRYLGRKSLHFWCWYFGITRPEIESSLHAAQMLGGAG